jgi:hypothetical protein
MANHRFFCLQIDRGDHPHSSLSQRERSTMQRDQEIAAPQRCERAL